MGVSKKRTARAGRQRTARPSAKRTAPAGKKRVGAARSVPRKKATGIASGGAPVATSFQEIHGHLRNLLRSLSLPLVVRESPRGDYHLYSVKPGLVVAGRPRAEVYFAGVSIRSRMVAFYLFPVYTHPEEFRDLPAAAGKCLVGKSCFNIKHADPQLLSELKELVDRGRAVYEREGWL